MDSDEDILKQDVRLLDTGNIVTRHGGHQRRRLTRRAAKIIFTIAACLCVIFVVSAVAVVVPCVYQFVLAPSRSSKENIPSQHCNSHCNLSIIESTPENLTYSNNSQAYLSTYLAWMQLLSTANTNITVSSFYWSLRENSSTGLASDKQGLDIFNGLKEAAARGVKIRVVQVPPSGTFPNTDSKVLADMGVIELRNLDFASLLGAGIIHTKMWIVDDQHFYIGSANMDWRALTQIKELGIMGMNCGCLASDAQKIFEVYWKLAADGTTAIPDRWPDSLKTSFNLNNTAKLDVNGTPAEVFIASSPPALHIPGRTDDLTGLLNVINKANDFIYIAVMDYIPAIIYSKSKKYWPYIDDALRTAAYERGVKVRVLGSYWNHTYKDMILFLNSLNSLNGVGPLKGTIETRYFTVPALKNRTIPYARVNHNKYMVTDNAAYIGTSNWSGDYFVDTAGVSCVVNQTNGTTPTTHTIQKQLLNIFERDWNSPYSTDDPNI